MKRLTRRLGAALACVCLSTFGTQLPGPLPDGGVQLPNQWQLRPAGKQIPLGSYPINIAMHPSGKQAIVLHSGYGQHELVVVDLQSAKVTQHVALSEAFYGVVVSADGKQVYCSGAGDEVVHRYDFVRGQLTNGTAIKIHEKVLRGVPSGLALNKAQNHLFVANVWGDCISAVDLPSKKVIDILLGTRPLSKTLNPVIPPEKFDTAEGAERRFEIGFYETSPDDTCPYACLLDEKAHRLYVSQWAQASVRVLDSNSLKPIATWRCEEHPCEMALTRAGSLLYVANANLNTVTVFDTKFGRAIETLSASLYANTPPGSTPNSLALSPDEKTLYVANATLNAIAVFDVSTKGKGRSLGFIPVGWYPTSVRVTRDGKRLIVANACGVTAKPNYVHGERLKIQTLFPGTLDIIDLPHGKDAEGQFSKWTAEVYQCSPLRDKAAAPAPTSANNPVPARVGDASPMKYVIYIVKENRTYDQVLGDMKEGNGEPKICIFGEQVTPNQHKISRQFVLLDNFYADAEVSADGHEWSMGAYCTDFVEKMWRMNYGHNRNGKFPYAAEGYFEIASPAGGYLWDTAKRAGVSYRSYGEFVSYDQPADKPGRPRVKSLEGHIDPMYRAFDMSYRDLDRTKRWISEFKRLEQAGEMPRLQIIRLPGDHTHGTSPKFQSPAAFVAENDYCVGQICETVSKSSLWPQTAIFIIEDDAQSGSDHVDAHRTTAYVVSPYTRLGKTDSTMYSTSSMLRTMELILGLQPMSQFDAAARPMYNSFQAKADVRPYEIVQPQMDINQKNIAGAYGSAFKFNFAKEDACDDILLNDVIWKSVRGRDSVMPAPVHAAFVYSHVADND
ncbi:MAG: bifunctional YncE family protein/alkaline phosphatase family protein [Limisphaerales bacterium]